MTSVLRFVISENALNFIALFQLKSRFLDDRLSIIIAVPLAFSKSMHKIQSTAELPKTNQCLATATSYPTEDNVFWNNTFVKGPQKGPVAHRALCGQEEGQATPGWHTSNPWPFPQSTSKEDLLLSGDHSTASCFLVVSKKGFSSFHLPLWCPGQKNQQWANQTSNHAYSCTQIFQQVFHSQRKYLAKIVISLLHTQRCSKASLNGMPHIFHWITEETISKPDPLYFYFSHPILLQIK